MMSFKKVLFIDTTLHKRDATGITLSNLFAQWPKDSLYMIGDTEKVSLSRSQGYEKIFTLGNDELKHAFPLGALKTVAHFILRYRNTHNQSNTSQKTEIISNAKTQKPKNKILRIPIKLIKRICLALGLNHLLLRCKISKKLDRWITEANPDYCYALLSTRHSILFALEIVKKYNKPLIIHIMDDWPGTIGKDTIAPNFWNKKINSELKKLLLLTENKIGISQLMAEEYKKKFGGNWMYFHNPVVLSNWRKFQKKCISKPEGTIKIGYFGRIGRANEYSIKIFLDIVSSGQLKSPIEFHLFTNNTKTNTNYNNNVFFHSFLENSLMPATICSFDFLLLPISFLDKDILFAKYSIPTKLSEYLISGVPVILFAPKNIALSEFVSVNNCGLCINTTNTNLIVEKLNNFLCDLSLQSQYSINGKNIAINKFEITNVGERFIQIFKTD